MMIFIFMRVVNDLVSTYLNQRFYGAFYILCRILPFKKVWNKIKPNKRSINTQSKKNKQTKYSKKTVSMRYFSTLSQVSLENTAYTVVFEKYFIKSIFWGRYFTKESFILCFSALTVHFKRFTKLK